MPTRSWELLHLIFVGIAVSYGLFSSRNQEETEKEPPASKFDSTDSYVSRLLQVPFVFDDEPDKQSDSTDEISKLETRSIQYALNEPEVLLAKEHKQRVHSIRSSCRIGEKPQLLPVRSLKSRVLEDTKELVDETTGVSSSPCISRSSSNLLGSKRFVGSVGLPGRMTSSQRLGESEEKVEEKEAVVLPSPIPWRSRSGRMEVKEDFPGPVSPFSSTRGLDHFQAKPEVSKPHISALSRANSGCQISPSPKKSPLSSELQTQTAEDFMRRKSFQKSPPPPPPPSLILRSSSMTPRSSSGSHLDGVSLYKDLRRSYSSEQMDVSRVHSGIQMKPRRIPLHDVGKSRRTFRAQKDGRPGGYGAEEAEEMTLVEKTWEKTGIARKPSSLKPPEGFVEDVLSESDEESPASGDDAGGTSKNEEVGPGSSVSDGGPDVDKKADEFIAMFREQIRLQRIDSIKRSSAEISRSLSR